MRNFDLNGQFEAVKKSAIGALKETFPVEGKLRTLTADNIWVEDKADPTDYSAQAALKSKDGTWGVPVYASLTLKDKQSGKVLDHVEKMKMFNLPKITGRFSYIVNGNEYQVTNQLRLKPGVYTMRKQNGELKTQINLAKGRNFDLAFNETSGTFTIQKVGGGQANIPLHPILLHLGISAQAIAGAWGANIEAANRKADPKSVSRAEAAFGQKPGKLKEYFRDSTSISPDTTKELLGKSFDRVDGLLLLSASKKLLDVHLGKQEPDDRDSLKFKALHSTEDFIQERIDKNKKSLIDRANRSIDNLRRDKITQILNPAAFNSIVESFFTQDDKSSTPEQINPVEMLAGQYRTTVMGSGGIKSDHAITSNMREIHSTHYGFIDPIHSPEGNVGVNLNLPMGVVKDGKEIKATLLDKSGKPVFLTPAQAFESVVAFPAQTGSPIKALLRGKVITVPRDKVDYFTPSPKALFSWSSNLIPYLATDQGNRAMMAAKQIEQAISLKHREAPLVQVSATPTSTMEQAVGNSVAIMSPVEGKVKKVTPDAIFLQGPDGEVKINTYNNYALNRKSFLHHTAVVKAGDVVKKGQLLADSNFTKNGVLALGSNLRTAYLPYKGLNFDDGIVITESAAEKLTSEHIHKKSYTMDENSVLNLVAFKSNYPNSLTSDNLSKLDNDGCIKKGAVVKTGDIIIAALKRVVPNQNMALLGKKLAERPKDDSVSWNMEDSGVVMEVVKTSKYVSVSIKTEERAKIGDKLAGRHGNKGVITHILPDAHAPKNANGEHVEVLLNPAGVISRINIGQIYESAASKVASKSKKPIVINNFSGENYLKQTKDLLKKSQVNDKEELFDAKTGKSLGMVHVGIPNILKLAKQSSVNYSVRQGGPGESYDAHMQPTKGGEEGAKALDQLTMYSLLSHGARANLREMSAIKSTSNDEYWKALKSGQQLPTPKAPFAYNKFISYLKGAGVDVKKEGNKLTLGPLTDADTHKMSAGEIKKPLFYRAKDGQPIKGGLFDPVIMGGFKGDKWGHMTMNEPVLNPVFENAARKLTGLGKKFDEILAGKMHLDTQGNLNTEGKGVTGGAALDKILKTIDVDKSLADINRRLPLLKGSVLDDANKKARYLMALKEAGLKPNEAYVRKVLPVLPTVYRPIYPRPDGSMTVSNLNFLYQNVGILNSMMNLDVMKHLPESEKAGIRKDLYEHVKGLSGLTDINIKGRPREGFISEIKGGAKGQPKEGFFISKLVSKKQDFVGRGTIIPEPDLGVDEMAMPEDMAWKLFEPLVIREMKNHGKTPIQAKEEISKKTILARKTLDQVMRERHVLLNRAPSLHKFSIMAFKPKITSGKSLKIPPLVNTGFNGDYDGDTMTVHVPMSDDANKEAQKMLPSRNLFQPGTGALMLIPSQEAQVGLYYLSKTSVGRDTLNKMLPAKFKVTSTLDKKATRTLLGAVARAVPSNEFANIIKALKDAGEKYTYDNGFTLGLNDLGGLEVGRDKITKELENKLAKTKNPNEVAALNEEYSKKLHTLISNKLSGKNNPLYDMVDSGAKGSPSQLRSILTTPMLVTDAKGKIVPKVIHNSYAEGLSIPDYWVSMAGARRGMMDRSIQSQKPGAFSKDIMATALDNVISGDDCGTKEGILMRIDNPDALDRYTAGDQKGVPHNSVVDSALISKFKKSGAQTIKVRSPLRCLRPKGTCAKCFGLDEHGHLPSIGDNIGVKAGQAIAEPLQQGIMNAFHTGGTAGGASNKSATGFTRVQQLMQLPKIVVGAATLAPVDGKVTNITKGLAGGYDVTVGGKTVHVAKGLKLKVALGQSIRAGDPLSDGVIKPQDLVKLKGMHEAQSYIASELQEAYRGMGQNIHSKMFETVVRSLGNTTKVVNNPKGSDFIPGDIAPYTVVENYNKNLDFVGEPDKAVGHALTKAAGDFKAGHLLTSKDADILKAKGIKEVHAKREAIVHAPVLKGMSTLPILRRDWMAALGYRYLAKNITEGAGQGWTTELSSYHPIPAFAHGATFGQGEEGKY